jgi:hypothetical protein
MLNKSIQLLIILIVFFSFELLKAKESEQPVSNGLINLDGSLGFNLGSYNVNGISPRDKDFRYSLTGGVNVNLLGINFPFSMVVSDQQREFTQPSNQFGVSPTYKWMTFHAGWRSLSYSPFTLAGHTFLGAGFDLNPGDFRFSAMYGRFQKACSGGDSNNLYSSPPSFDRTGFSAKLGYGTSTNFIDLIVLRAKDNISSLDSTQSFIKPEENMVLGLSGKLNLLDHLFFDVDVSTSIYTNDIRAGNMPDSASSGFIHTINKIFPYSMSSQFTKALQTSLSWRSSNYGIKLSYKRVDPDFKSMGAYFIESDVENIIIAPNVNLLNRALKLSGSVGFQRDNLLNTKQQQSQRIVASAGISFNKSDFGIDLKYSTYGITQYKGLNPLIDSLKVARVNNSITGSSRLTFQTDSLLNNIIIVGAYQTLIDLNARTSAASQSDNYTANLAYQVNLLSAGMFFGIGLNYVQSVTSGSIIVFIGPTAQIGKTIDNFNISSSFSYQVQKMNSESNGGTASLNLQASYQINKHNSINMNFNVINSGNSTVESPNFTEYRSNLGYVHNF